MILQRIVEHKKQEVRELLSQVNPAKLAREAAQLAPTRDFKGAINRKDKVALIAEIKKASPSKGILCPNFDHLELARIYRDNGAAAVSVLTDHRFFGGKLAYLTEVRQTIDLPVLRKDFIIDPVQIYQSRLAGADAVLLIAAILPGDQLRQLLNITRETGMQALVEVHNAVEVEQALKAGADLVGINNRDLNTFITDLATTGKLIDRLKRPALTVVSESGIKDYHQLEYLRSIGVHGALVGEALVTADDIGLKVRELTAGGDAVV
ncbi:indole-3-glycerol phosphate synthase TrpC [Desulfotomaculum nigrificans]|uniref:indole-3-glycerol phosphate synthase TrpC n=1 Tax=Desulfotomaculum nigrificans TaxID=1565 RepID=UPI0001FAE501|nr:indole-3-glycerol phosphate synthase TrpC [Desulfotomaculum nigrificans]